MPLLLQGVPRPLRAARHRRQPVCVPVPPARVPPAARRDGGRRRKAPAVAGHRQGCAAGWRWCVVVGGDGGAAPYALGGAYWALHTETLVILLAPCRRRRPRRPPPPGPSARRGRGPQHRPLQDAPRQAGSGGQEHSPQAARAVHRVPAARHHRRIRRAALPVRRRVVCSAVQLRCVTPRRGQHLRAGGRCVSPCRLPYALAADKLSKPPPWTAIKKNVYVSKVRPEWPDSDGE